MNTKSYFFARVARVLRLPDNFMLASGMNTNNETCAAEQEGASRWTRGGAGVASFEETCLRGSDDLYTWTTGASGGTVGLAAHIADTSTHGISSEIVGRTEVQTLTNKTLTSPVINTPTGIVKGDVGLGNVDNTSDATKNAAAVTLTNKTLTTPTIADFTNMGHDHLDADDGGTLAAAAITSGTIATARLGSGTADSLTFLRGDQTWNALPIAPGAWPAAFVDAFGTLGTSNGQFTTIRDLAVSDAGSVYVSSDDRVQKFSANGTYTSTIATVGTGNGQVDDPWGLWATGTTLGIADNANDRFQLFVSEVYSAKAGSAGTALGQFAGPRGIAYSTQSGSGWYIVDAGNNRVQRYVVGTGFVAEFDFGVSAFSSPTGIAIDPSWRAWIVDTGNHQVQVLNVSITTVLFANPLFAFGESGAGFGQFSSPNSIAIDRNGLVYVTDTGNDRVQVFSPEGLFLGFFGESGTGDGQFNGPTAIAISDDYIYVGDSGNSRVQIFANPSAVRRDSTYIHFIMYDGTTSNVWTNMPAAATELLANAFFRKIADLTGKSEFRLVADIFTAGATGADLHLEYTTDTTGAAGWTDAGTQATQEIDIGTTGYRFGAWTTLAPAARGSVILRIVGTSGNGVADPFVTNLNVEVR